MGRASDEDGRRPDGGRARRRARGNAELARYIAGHVAATIAEWALLIGVLVYAYEQHGARVAGLASLATQAPYVLLSSTTARLAQRHPPALVRGIGLGTGMVGCAAAGVCATLDGPVAVVVAGSLAMFTAATMLRPVGAVLVPSIVRSSGELITANVRVGQCDNASVLLGPLAATGLLAIGGPSAVMYGCVGLGAIAVAASIPGMRHGPRPAAREDPLDSGDRTSLRRLLRASTSPFHDLTRVVRRRGALGVLAAEAGDYVLIGALDILLVVIAGEHLELGDAGAGILSALFGVGAFVSGVVSGRLARRARLAPAMVLATAALAAGCVAFGASISIVVACVALPILGIGRSVLSLLARVLLQRSAPPSQLPMVFGALETTSGIGLVIGSLLAQVLLAIGGVTTALFGLGVVFAALTVATVRPLRAADDGADVPVVAMTLLHRLAMFEPLPTAPLEAVARSAVELSVADGEVVVREGELGDRFYAVADGHFDVTVSGAHIRTIGRGDGFGEIALLADVARTATVTAAGAGSLLAVDRRPFLVAVTGHEAAQQAAWDAVPHLHFAGDAPRRDDRDGGR